MKILILHKVCSAALSVLVLFSTLSFAIEKHYCGNILIDTAIFSEVKKCGVMDSETAIYVKKPCCKDTIDVFEGQDELKTSAFHKLSKRAKLTLIVFIYAHSKAFQSLPKLTIPHQYYIPPKLIRDLQVLDETFLI